MAKVLGRLCIVLMLALGHSALLHAQSWPTKVVKVVVPYPPGTGPDIVARAVADKLAKNLNQAVIVENKSGANAVVGTGAVVRAPADGHTLLIVDRLTLAVNPLLYAPLPYDASKDLVSISNLSDVNLYLVVNAGLPVNTFKDFVAYAKANPGKLSFGSGGIGSIMHLNLEAIQAVTGTHILHVPYKGFGEALPNLVAGTVQVSTIGVESIHGLVRDGKLRLLAVGAPNRIPLTPEVPTITEAGGTPGMLLSTSFTMHARAGAAPEVLGELGAQVRRAMQDTDLRTMLERRGQTPRGGTAQALDALLQNDRAEVEKLVKERGIKR
jgi:tripartite-type tricarboxylate transporter receptor subunit TctC